MLLGGLTSSVIAVGSANASASAPGVTANSITIGLITSLTGPSAAEDPGIVPAAKARIALQNARGGIDGRKIKLIVEDDGTNPVTNQTDSSLLLSKGVFGVIDDSAVAFGGYKILQKAGIPVTGGAYDGPEWFQQPNTNMFSMTGPESAKDPQTGALALFGKKLGAKNCGSVGYSISPSSTAAASGYVFSCQAEGLKNAYLNNTIPFGTLSVTPLSLEIKAAGVDSLYLPLDAETNFAILTTLKQAGVNLKFAVSATGYGQALLSDTSALPGAQGAWFAATGTPVELKTPATKSFQAALAKYAHYTGVPDFSWYEAWGATDLMIDGLGLAGKNPTQSRFISALHKVTNYDVGGLEFPVNFTLKAFGKAPSRQCSYLVQLKGDAFVNPTKVCGSFLPNSDQIPSA
jgi:branched-chain amino acid transport system substrate-binding protein